MTNGSAPATVSHSRLADYARCGEAYRLKRVVQVPQRPSVAQIAGKAWHQWAQDHEYGPLFGTWADYLESAVADAVAESGYTRAGFKVTGRKTKARPDGETLDVWRDELGPELCRLYEGADWGEFDEIATALPNDSKGNPNGLEYHLELGAPYHWQGYVDQIRVDRHGNLMVVDLKTWSRKRITTQLEEYCAAGQILGLPTVYACYYTARKGIVESKHIGKWSKDTLMQYINAGRTGINAGYFPPSVGDHCSWCDVAEHCMFRPYV